MEIVFCDKKDNKLIHNQMAWNPEIQIAIYKVSTLVANAFKVGCDQIYNYTNTYRALSNGNKNEIHDYIKSKKGRIIAIDENFERVMQDEGLEDALGRVQIIKIDFTITTTTNGKNCEPCLC